MRRGLLSVFLHKKYIHRCSFYLSGSVNKFLNFCVAYFPCCFVKMAIKISHSHFVHVAYVSILLFQTFDRIIFGTLTFPGRRWYVMTVRDTQMVRDQKKFENHWSRWSTDKSSFGFLSKRTYSYKTDANDTLHNCIWWALSVGIEIVKNILAKSLRRRTLECNCFNVFASWHTSGLRWSSRRFLAQKTTLLAVYAINTVFEIQRMTGILLS